MMSLDTINLKPTLILLKNKNKLLGYRIISEEFIY